MQVIKPACRLYPVESPSHVTCGAAYAELAIESLVLLGSVFSSWGYSKLAEVIYSALRLVASLQMLGNGLLVVPCPPSKLNSSSEVLQIWLRPTAEKKYNTFTTQLPHHMLVRAAKEDGQCMPRPPYKRAT